MPKSFIEVQDEYKQFKTQFPDDPTPLGEFAKQLDAVQGVQDRAEAYNDAWYKKANAAVDRAFEFTHLPDLAGGATGYVGRGFDALAGTNIAPTAERIGRDLPRMTAEAVLTVPEAASGVGIPAAAAMWGNRVNQLRKILGYGGTALSGYAATESPVGGAISAASMGAANKLLLPASHGGMDVTKTVADALRKRLGVTGAEIVPEAGRDLAAEVPRLAFDPANVLKNRLAEAGGAVGAAGAMTGLNEVTRQAQMSVGPHAVGPLDPSRNPLTADNVVGNVMNTLPFALQGAMGVRSASGFNPRQAEGMIKWVEERKAAVRENAEGAVTPTELHDEFGTTAKGPLYKPADAGQPELDLTAAIDAPAPKFNQEDMVRARTSVRTLLDAANEAERSGQLWDADHFRGRAKEVLDALGTTEKDIPMLQQAVREIGTQSRMMPPQDPQGLVDFVQKVNSVIDFWNENRVKVEGGELPETAPTSGPKQSWTPNARHPEVVQRLQGKGLLPKVTAEWLKTEYNATLDDLGNPQFATDVLAQKVANKLLDALPDALKTERSTTVVETTQSPQVSKINVGEAEFFRALGQFPPSVQDALIDRTIKYRRSPDAFVQGRQLNRYDSWQRAIVLAADTFDPIGQTIKVYKSGKVVEAPVTTLWSKDYEPVFTPVKAGAGGKGKVDLKGKTIPESNIEGLARPENVQPEGEQSVVEQAMEAGLSGDATQGAIYRKRGLAGESGVSPVEDLPIPAETQKAYDDQFYAKSQQLAKTIEALTPKAAWNVMRDVMTGKRAESKNVFREANAKTILQALVEVSGGSKGDAIGPAGKALLAAHEAAGYKNVGKSEREKVRELLKNLFKDYSPLEGVSKTAATPRGDLVVTNRAETALGRQKLVLERLLDAKAVEAAQRYGESRPMEQAGEKPLVRFAAPVRLRRWLSSPGMGVTPDSLGQIASKSVESLLSKLGITKDEMAIYKVQGLDKMLASPKVPVEALARWMEEKTPRVEVRKLVPEDDSKIQPAYNEQARRQHQLESLELAPRFDADTNRWLFGGLEMGELTNEAHKLASDYVLFHDNPPQTIGSSDAATGRYGVEPKELKDMPGAVDILVRIPTQEKGMFAGRLLDKDERGNVLYRGPHFGDSDVNVLASVRGYVETLPSGEKVFHVFEVQSDWGQKKSQAEQQVNNPHYNPEVARQYNDKFPGHPLLSVYEQLALKAAVAHARELGITKVALSDAETAMMTEGHDRYGRTVNNIVDEHGNVVDQLAEHESPEQYANLENGKYRVVPKVEVAQEQGMRAAYDVRLPSTMTKLVGKAGEYVEFGQHAKAVPDTFGPESDRVGSPVFKSKTGEPKTSISARMWDITGAPEEFSAYGYSRPMKKGGTGVGPMEDDWLGTRPPGSFERDVESTLRAHFTKIMGERGYAGTFRDLAVEAGMAIARQVRDVPVDFYKVKDKVAGLANAVEGRGKVGLNLDEGMTGYGINDDMALVHKVLSVFTHELAHIDDFIRLGMLEAPDAFSKERKRQLDNLNSMFTALDEDQRRAILLTLDEGLNPPKYRFAVGENPSQLEAAVKSPEEFQAGVMQMVTNSLLFGKEKGLKNALDVLDYSPTEIQEHAQFQYRAIRDVLEALESTLAQPEILDASKGSVYPNDPNPFITSHAFTAVVAAAKMGARVREGTLEVAAARDWVKSLGTGAGGTIPAQVTEATWLRRAADINKYHKEVNKGPYAMASATEAIDLAQRSLGMSYKEPGWWSRWLYPFANLTWSMERAGFDLARPLFNLMNDTESAIHRRYSDMVSPFVKRRPDGTFDWDAEHPLIQKVSQEKRGPWSKAFNDVSAWQVEHDSQPMFSEVDGKIVVNEAARKDWEAIRAKLSLEDQQVVQVASVAADKVGQNMGRHTLSVLDESMTLRVASLLSILDRKMTYDQAYSAADRITEAYMTGNVLSLQGTARPEWMPSLDRLLGGPTGLVSSFKEVEQMLSARTGYRTEQLPGDWIIMYKDKEGLTKFASAPDESRAEYVRNRLVQQGAQPMGEIVNRADLRSKYQAFDDPDVLLQKFAQVEGRAWDSVVEDVRTRLGSEIADDLKGSFTPGAASLKDVGQQGFAKFLKPSASQVDRTQLDYLDAMFARVARLSASASYKTHGAMKDLILGDPRARLYPSLRQMVDDHWAQMLAPTSDLTKKIKAVTTGYFLGANLASMAVEGTQSMMSVIPTLIAGNVSGGPLKAYRQLFSAIGDSTNMSLTTEWQNVAKVAEAKLERDPTTKLSTEETRALMYRRAVVDGIIGHGVIQDLLFSRDAKTLQTAKFGQGDYGPVSKADLAGNGLYLGAQMMTSWYGRVSKFNDKIAFFAGLNQGIEKGLEGDALYNHARQFKSLSTFGGGKANTIGAVSYLGKAGPGMRSAVGVVNTLQQYGYGMVALYGQFAKDSIDASKSLTPQQRSQSRKAFGTMLATQIAVGGALGVPFAGAALTLIEKMFGVPANQLVRQGLAGLGQDDDQGGVIAETVLNGFGNQALGLDVSSRVGVSNLLGTSSYRGFNVQDLLGPTPSLVTNMAKALNWFGQNEPVKAARELVPAAFKNLVAMSDSRSKYGDVAIRDSSNNLLYTPSDNQAIGYALGFRSREASQKMQAGHLVQAQEKRMLSQQDRELDTQAQRLLRGDANSPRQYAQELRYSDPTVNTTDVLRGVMERAVRATQEKDLLASGTRRGADERASIVKTFGSDINTRQSEVDMTKMRMQLAARLGDPKLMPQADAWSRAAVIDQLVRSRGMPRSQAVALVQMMGM